MKARHRSQLTPYHIQMAAFIGERPSGLWGIVAWRAELVAKIGFYHPRAVGYLHKSSLGCYLAAKRILRRRAH